MQAAQRITGNRIIQAGDVLDVDMSAEIDGYFADTGGTVVIQPATCKRLASVTPPARRLPTQ